MSKVLKVGTYGSMDQKLVAVYVNSFDINLLKWSDSVKRVYFNIAKNSFAYGAFRDKII